jgi:hypothetical protein
MWKYLSYATNINISHPRKDAHEGFFAHWIEENHLIDLKPPKLSQTWRNVRKGEKMVSKRLDRFLISKDMLDIP